MRKLNDTNIMRIIYGNVVQGRLSENYLTRKLIARNIFYTKYSRTRVIPILYHVLIAIMHRLTYFSSASGGNIFSTSETDGGLSSFIHCRRPG